MECATGVGHGRCAPPFLPSSSAVSACGWRHTISGTRLHGGVRSLIMSHARRAWHCATSLPGPHRLVGRDHEGGIPAGQGDGSPHVKSESTYRNVACLVVAPCDPVRPDNDCVAQLGTAWLGAFDRDAVLSCRDRDKNPLAWFLRPRISPTF